MLPADTDFHAAPDGMSAGEQPDVWLGRVLFAALVLGVLGDILLRALPYGLNAAVWAVAALACAAGLLYWRQRRLPVWAAAFLSTGAAFGLCLAWRDSVYLKWLAAGCFLVCAALAAGVVGGFAPAFASFLEYFGALLRGAARILFGGWRALTAADPRKWRVDALRKPWLAALLRGVLLAVPILAVFTLLFASADRAFGDLITRTFTFDLEFLPRHAAAFALSAYLAAGLLCAMVSGIARYLPDDEALRDIQTGGIEAAIVFGAVDALFLAFVAVQFQYFFGGSGRIESVAELTYSEYARRGFFELCAVTVLTLLLQYFFHWLSRGGKPREKTVCRLLSVLMLLLVAVIMVSALMRMQLYVEAYGLTQLRFYSTAFMVWIGFSLAWFAVTALWGRVKRFTVGMVLSGLVFVVAFYAMNPCGVIVSWNLGRVAAGEPFDARYAVSLGADAVPALVAGLDRLGERDADTVREGLMRQWHRREDDGWRIWNWSRARAARALEGLFGDAPAAVAATNTR